MNTSFSRAVEAGLVGGLSAMSDFLDKLSEHAEAKPCEPRELLEARLFPNMFTFAQQLGNGAAIARRTQIGWLPPTATA